MTKKETSNPRAGRKMGGGADKTGINSTTSRLRRYQR